MSPCCDVIIVIAVVCCCCCLSSLSVTDGMEDGWSRRTFLDNFFALSCPEAMLFGAVEAPSGGGDLQCKHVAIPVPGVKDAMKIMKGFQSNMIPLRKRKIKVEIHEYVCQGNSNECSGEDSDEKHHHHNHHRHHHHHDEMETNNHHANQPTNQRARRRHVFVENLSSSKNLETIYYITDQTQTSDFFWLRESGIRINIGLFDVHLSPVLRDVQHRGDNDYALSNPSASNDAEPTKNIIKRMCRNPLPDHYSLTLEVFKDRTTKALTVPCSPLMASLNKCLQGGVMVRRMLNEACPLSGSYPDILEPAPNSVVCTDLDRDASKSKPRKESKLSDAEREFPVDDHVVHVKERQVPVSEIFQVTRKDERFIRAMSRECRQATADCEMCVERQNCSDMRYHVCCLAACHSSESCRIMTNSQCQESSVECIMGDAYRMTIVPIMTSPREEFRCHVSLQKPKVLFHLWFYVSVAEIGFETPKEFATLPFDPSRFDLEKGAEILGEFLEVEHGVNMKVEEEYILVGKNRSKSWSYSLQPLNFREDSSSPLTSHQMSDTLISLSTTFDRPFAYSTSSWMDGRECAKNTTKFRPVDKIRNRHGLDIKANVLRLSDGSFEYQIESMAGPAYIKFFVSGYSSVLRWWFKNQTSKLMHSSIRSSVDYSAESRLWTINVSGRLTSCPGLLTMDISDVLENEEVARYDVLISCPPSFNLSIIIPTPRLKNTTKMYQMIFTDQGNDPYRVFLSYLFETSPGFHYARKGDDHDERMSRKSSISDNLLEEMKFFAYQIMPACLILLCALVVQSVLVYRRSLNDDHCDDKITSDDIPTKSYSDEISDSCNKPSTGRKFDDTFKSSDLHSQAILLKKVHFKKPIARRLVITAYSVMKILSSIFFTATSLIFFIHSIIVFRHSWDIETAHTGFELHRQEHKMKQFILQNYRHCAHTPSHLKSTNILLQNHSIKKQRSGLVRYLEMRSACHDYIGHLIRSSKSSLSIFSKSNQAESNYELSKIYFDRETTLRVANENFKVLRRNFSGYFSEIMKPFTNKLVRISETSLLNYGELLRELDSNLWTKPAWNDATSGTKIQENIWKHFMVENHTLWKKNKYLVNALKEMTIIDIRPRTIRESLKNLRSHLKTEDLFATLEDKFIRIHLRRNCTLNAPHIHAARRYLVSNGNDVAPVDSLWQHDTGVDAEMGSRDKFPSIEPLVFQPLILVIDIVLFVLRIQHLFLLLTPKTNSCKHSPECSPSKADNVYWSTLLFHKNRCPEINCSYYFYYKCQGKSIENQSSKQREDANKATKVETGICSKCGSLLHSSVEAINPGTRCSDDKQFGKSTPFFEIKTQRLEVKPQFLSKLIMTSGTIILLCLAQVALKSFGGQTRDPWKNSIERLLTGLESSCQPTKSLHNSPINAEGFDFKSLEALLSYASSVRSTNHSTAFVSCAHIESTLQNGEFNENVYESLKDHMDTTHYTFIFKSLEVAKKIMESSSHIVAALSLISVIMLAIEHLLLRSIRSDPSKSNSNTIIIKNVRKNSSPENNEKTLCQVSSISEEYPERKVRAEEENGEMTNTRNQYLSNLSINIPRAWQHMKKNHKISRNFYETNV